MPEGDTIFRAARTLHRALTGRTVTRFESVFPRLSRVDQDRPLSGRSVERVEARGKHLLIWFSGDLVLRTHMRMKGSWHIYRPGERWQRPARDMRIAITTDAFEAVAFNVPVAELISAGHLARHPSLRSLGPDPLADSFDAPEAARRIASRGDVAIADVLLDQQAIAGIGNIFKSEILFVARTNPFTPARELVQTQIETIVQTAVRLMRMNVAGDGGTGIATYAELRRTTRRADSAARRWVYGRKGRPCRRCGILIAHRAQGSDARSTYWCPGCQAYAARRDASAAKVATLFRPEP